MEGFQSKIRTIIYSIFAVIVGIVLIRVFLKLVGANPNNEFAQFWYGLSDIFVKPWATIYPSYSTGKMVIETYSIVATLFYICFSVIASKSATSAFDDSRKQAIIDIVDSLFKIAEFLLITRFVFKLTAASLSSSFVHLIYDLSWVVYKPFSTLLPSISFEDAVFEISTLVALIIIIILDIVTEQLLWSLLDALFPNRPKSVKKTTTHNIVSQPPTNPLPPAQNITINMPQPPNYIDQRSVNVRPTPQHPQHTTNVVVQKPQRRGFLGIRKVRSARQAGKK